ncbi:MAG: hypothetical protein HY665_08875, partial [Chloroflexi bacterium]|nr:hypothetical protein [Chloroflexota bacterium]
IRTVLVEAVRSGEMRPDIDIDAASTIIFGLIQGMVSIWTLSGRNFDLKDRYESLWSIFKRAIEAT